MTVIPNVKVNESDIKVKTLLYADWYTQVEPTLSDIAKAGLLESQVSDAAMAATDQSLAGILSRSLAPFNELPKMPPPLSAILTPSSSSRAWRVTS